MHGGEESLPSAPLIGLMRSRVNRRTNERVPLFPGTDAQRLSFQIADYSCGYYIGVRAAIFLLFHPCIFLILCFSSVLQLFVEATAHEFALTSFCN